MSDTPTPPKPVVVGWVDALLYSHLVIRKAGEHESLACGHDGETWPDPKAVPGLFKCDGCRIWLRTVDHWAPLVWRKVNRK